MTKRLSIMLAIAILLLVNTVMGEGGPLDNIAGNSSNAELAAAGPDVTSDEEGQVVLASKIAPPRPTADAIGWYNEGEEAETAAPQPLVSERRESQSPWQSSASSEGALPRHRLGVEE